MVKNGVKSIVIISIILFGIIHTGYLPANVKATPDQLTAEKFVNEIMNVTEFAYTKKLWTNEQWEYYIVDLPKDTGIDIKLDYTGDLDLDLRIYMDDDPFKSPDEQTNYAWDITHRGMPDTEPIRNSQNRTTSGSEEVQYFNKIFLKPRRLYILVFVYDGLGSSIYNLTANLTLSRVTATGLAQGFGILQWWLVFFAGIGAVTGFFVYLGHYLKIPKEERIKRKIQKQKKKLKVDARGKPIREIKVKKRKTKKISMKKRITKRRR